MKAAQIDKTNPLWPFAGPCYGGRQLYQLAVDDRLAAVREMDREALEAALLVPGLQKTVESVIRSKLRKLGVKA
jgi:hypothetical protein